MSEAVTVRPLQAADGAAWERLYQGYAALYKVAQTAEMRARVWGWLMDERHEMTGLVAQKDGALVGLAHVRPFARPLSATVGGYLDDLFVDPAARGAGVADALFAAIKAEGQARGWSVIRWITADDNYRARSVYDRLAERTKWITYDMKV